MWQMENTESLRETRRRRLGAEAGGCPRPSQGRGFYPDYNRRPPEGCKAGTDTL